MATGYNRSKEGRHKVIYDHCCTTCEGENLNTEALYYCKECSQFFCELCKKSHNKFFKTHKLLGRNEIALWGDVKHVTVSVMCDEHPGKEMEMYCQDHGCVCCHICTSVNHRTCEKVKPVSQVAKGIQKKSEFKFFLSEADMTQSRLNSRYEKQENNIKMLQTARGEIISTLKNMRQKFNKIIDRLEEGSTTELDRLLVMLKDQVTSFKDACLDIHAKIQELHDDIQTLGKHCDELAFQGYKICSKHIASAKNFLSSKQNVDYQTKFIPGVHVEQYLSSLETLGSFCVSKSLTSDHNYSVVNKHTYDVKTSGDTRPVGLIKGICQLPDGQIAVVDNRNTKVKLLSNSTYSVVNELKLSSIPQDICYTTGAVLAVTMCQWIDTRYLRKEIQFIDAWNGKLSHIRTVQLDHDCGGIAYNNALLYVCSKDALYVHNLSGKKIKKLYQGTSGEFSQTYRVSLSDDGSRIYVIHTHKHLLLTLDKTGRKLSTFSDPELPFPTCLSVADNGSVFVCVYGSNTVLQVDREGKRKMTTVATQNDGINKPWSLFYDRKTHTLLVGQTTSSGKLLALELE